MGKEVKFSADARNGLQEGLDILANAVKATLGPKGRHAAIERMYGPPLITKDGVTVARSITLDDKIHAQKLTKWQIRIWFQTNKERISS